MASAMKSTLRLALLASALTGLVASVSVARAAGADAPPTDVLFFDHAKVDGMLAGPGGSLLNSSLYKVSVSRRTGPGIVEIHTHDTDVFYILQGTGTFVTGGTAVGQESAGPGQIHAKSIVGGTEHHLSKGDVIIIPHGTPHQFTEINGPFLYFVVKVVQ